MDVQLRRQIRTVYVAILLAVSLLTSVSFGQNQEYVLQAGDVISVNVVEHAEFSGRHKIRPDGRINYPVIGEVDVASLTPAQLVKIMEGKLAAYVNNPVVSVSIEAYYANVIFVIGGVGNPGQHQIYEPIDVMKVIAMCGGLQDPKVKYLKIIRADGHVIKIHMDSFWGSDERRDNRKWVMYPGDTLYVPSPFTIPWALISTILGIISTSLSLYLVISSLGRR